MKFTNFFYLCFLPFCVFYPFFVIENIILILFLVPPDRPIIYETKRREKAKNVEAYNEGSDVVLICEVSGGTYITDPFLFFCLVLLKRCFFFAIQIESRIYAFIIKNSNNSIKAKLFGIIN